MRSAWCSSVAQPPPRSKVTARFEPGRRVATGTLGHTRTRRSARTGRPRRTGTGVGTGVTTGSGVGVGRGRRLGRRVGRRQRWVVGRLGRLGREGHVATVPHVRERRRRGSRPRAGPRRPRAAMAGARHPPTAGRGAGSLGQRPSRPAPWPSVAERSVRSAGRGRRAAQAPAPRAVVRGPPQRRVPFG